MLKVIKEKYKPEFEEIRENMKQALHMIDVNETLDGIITDVTGNPGKMLRPLLMLLVAGECKEGDRKELLATAAAMELIHNSSLVLDDMLDEAPVRRGEPTVSAEYGNPVALCTGEYILASACRYLHELGYLESSLDVLKITQMACNGEMIQNVNRRNTNAKKEDYIEAVRGKTAALFSVTCESACRITHRDREVKEKMILLGDTLGIMFQIRDDLLDWTAEEKDIGKPVNIDFAEGVYTLPAIYTFKDPLFGSALKDIAKKEDLLSEDLLEARRLVREAGGIEYTEGFLKELGKKAAALLSFLPDPTNKSFMEKVISFIS